MDKDFLKGWKYEITFNPGYKVGWENQYNARIVTPDGQVLTNSLFVDHVGFYARNANHAERKVIKMIRRYVKDAAEKKDSYRAYGM